MTTMIIMTILTHHVSGDFIIRPIIAITTLIIQTSIGMITTLIHGG